MNSAQVVVEPVLDQLQGRQAAQDQPLMLTAEKDRRITMQREFQFLIPPKVATLQDAHV